LQDLAIGYPDSDHIANHASGLGYALTRNLKILAF
jgi:hypothetical protein